jgi:hypothetical protein
VQPRIFSLLFLGTTFAADLDPRTTREFRTYLAKVEPAMALSEPRWPDLSGEAVRVEPWAKEPTVKVTDGLIHDWVAAQFARGITGQRVAEVLAIIDRYPEIYAPEVRQAKLLSRQGERSTISMRFVKKKIITVVLDSEFAIETTRPRENIWSVISRSSNIWELEDPEAANPKRRPAGTGFGFLWNLNSYWLIEERSNGVYVQCRAISLTRGIPTGLGWAIKPMITSLPRESLEKTLRDTVKAATP